MTAREEFLVELGQAMDGREAEVVDRMLDQMGMTIVRKRPPRAESPSRMFAPPASPARPDPAGLSS